MLFLEQHTCLPYIPLTNKLVLGSCRVDVVGCRLFCSSGTGLLFLRDFASIRFHRQAPLPLLQCISCRKISARSYS